MKISTIMPVMNGERFLIRALDSFVSQNIENKELIIVDGRSTDRSHEIIGDYLKNHGDCIKWVQEADTGLSHARNIGVAHATGEIISFFAADDILHKDIFDKVIYYAEVVDFDVLYCSCLLYNGYAKECVPGQAPFRKLTRKQLLKGDSITAGECFYYKRHIFDSHKYDESLKYCMDYEFNLQLAFSQDPQYFFFGLDEPGLIACLHEDNISTKFHEKQCAEVEQVIKRYGGKARWLRKLFG